MKFSTLSDTKTSYSISHHQRKIETTTYPSSLERKDEKRVKLNTFSKDLIKDEKENQGELHQERVAFPQPAG